MNYKELTAPCGLDCFNCDLYLAHEDREAWMRVKELAGTYNVPISTYLCKGCRAHDGQIPVQKHLFGDDHYCAAYECTKSKGVDFCSDCDDFPCDHLHPLADKAEMLPHNMKVFNCCLIKKMGLEEWAKSKAGKVRKDYFERPWSLKSPNE